MNLVDDVVHRQRRQIRIGLRPVGFVRLDHDRRIRVDLPDRLGGHALQIPVIVRRRHRLHRFVHEIVGIKLRMILEPLCDPSPDLDEMVGVLLLKEHAHVAARNLAARRRMQIDDEFDVVLLRLIHRFLKVVEFAVQPLVILGEIDFRPDRSPVAGLLGADQIHIPLLQGFEVFGADGSRRHDAALAAMIRDALRIFDLVIEVDPVLRRKQDSGLKRIEVELDPSRTVLQSERQHAGFGRIAERHIERKRLPAVGRTECAVRAGPLHRRLRPRLVGQHELHAVVRLRRFRHIGAPVADEKGDGSAAIRFQVELPLEPVVSGRFVLRDVGDQHAPAVDGLNPAVSAGRLPLQLRKFRADRPQPRLGGRKRHSRKHHRGKNRKQFFQHGFLHKKGRSTKTAFLG